MLDADVSEADTTAAAGADDATGADGAAQGGDAGQVQGAPDTVLTGAGDEAKAPPADWPEDWRDRLAKGDDKLRKRLDRFQSPADVLTSWQSLEKKLSSGAVKEALPKDATDEQVAAWRKDNGIPETPDGYLEKLPNGLVIGEQDKPVVADFLASAHEAHADPAVVGKMLDWYYDHQEKAAAVQAEADRKVRSEAVEELRAEWGGDYRANLNAALNFLDAAPPLADGKPLKEALLGARLANGTLFGDNPAVLRWLARLAADANPAGFVSPGAGGSQAQSVADEIASIEKVMRENRAAYNKDEKMQARLRQLYEAQEKLASRG